MAESSAPDRFERQAELVPRARIRAEAATVIGVGAIGRAVALQLAALGVPRLQLIDFDVVEPTNVTTQGFRAEDVGRPKVEAAAIACRALDPDLELAIVADRFRPSRELGTSVFCCVDAIATRAAIWRAVAARRRFWADGRMLGEAVRILVAGERGRKHYATTLFPQADAQRGRCTSRSTIYAAGLAAALMTHQFTRHLRGLPLDADATFNLLAGEYVVADVNESF